jgi:hypothetical protein
VEVTDLLHRYGELVDAGDLTDVYRGATLFAMQGKITAHLNL